jgi:hypothetical protein
VPLKGVAGTADSSATSCLLGSISFSLYVRPSETCMIDWQCVGAMAHYLVFSACCLGTYNCNI